jgi:CHAT domain-containing protein
VAASLDAPSPLVTAEAPPTMNDPTFRGVAPGCQDFQGLRFGALPGAGNEVAQVESQLPASATVADFTGTRASEPSFKRWAPGSSLIHLATHGFFLGAACRNPIQEGSGLGAVRGEISLGNPLLLSGLALAGANHRAQAGSEADDGVLTSEEIAAMDLSSARWVVLSACETGIGAIQSGEGVLGLRRAFRLAGAQTIIMSLWKVEDRATLEWMRDLYDGRGHGLSTAKAVQKASLDALKERRAEGRSTHPFYWGAFVAAGDWR